MFACEGRKVFAETGQAGKAAPEPGAAHPAPAPAAAAAGAKRPFGSKVAGDQFFEITDQQQEDQVAERRQNRLGIDEPGGVAGVFEKKAYVVDFPDQPWPGRLDERALFFKGHWRIGPRRT